MRIGYAIAAACISVIAKQGVAQNPSRDFGLLSPKPAVAFNSAANILQALGVTIRDAVLKQKVNDELQEIAKNIQQALVNSGDGYLVQVRLYTDVSGVPSVPGGQLLLPIGAGAEPVLVLADFVGHPQIVIEPPTGLSDSSYYLWITKDAQNSLSARTIPAEATPALRIGASAEARRRLLSPLSAALPKAPGVVDRAAYWHKVASVELARISSEARRKRIQELTKQFEKAQADVNSSFEACQRIKREIDEKQSRMNVLQWFAALTTALENGINATNLLLGDHAPKADGNPIDLESVKSVNGVST